MRNGCYPRPFSNPLIDWNSDEDRSRVRTGHGPRKHHPTATIRQGSDQIRRPTERRTENERADTQSPPGFRRSENDKKLRRRSQSLKPGRTILPWRPCHVASQKPPPIARALSETERRTGGSIHLSVPFSRRSPPFHVWADGIPADPAGGSCEKIQMEGGKSLSRCPGEGQIDAAKTRLEIDAREALS